MDPLFTVTLVLFAVDVVSHTPVSKGMLVFFVKLQDPLHDLLVLFFLSRLFMVQPFIIAGS